MNFCVIINNNMIVKRKDDVELVDSVQRLKCLTLNNRVVCILVKIIIAVLFVVEKYRFNLCKYRNVF
jgi:hypothetical protein